MNSKPPERSLAQDLGISAVGGAFSELVTIPLDTAKVRLQLQNRAGGIPVQNSFAVIRDITRNEGVFALFKGIEAGIHRQVLFTGFRVGLYPKLVSYVTGDKPRDEVTVLEKVAAAGISSALAITIGNPPDVVKVRTQAFANTAAMGGAAAAVASEKLAEPPKRTSNPPLFSPESRRRMCTKTQPVDMRALYEGPAVGVYRHIIRTEGVLGGLYAGYVPNLLRNTIISICEIVSYDVLKGQYKEHLGLEGVPLQTGAAMSAALIATALGHPMDVVSTRIMVNKSTGNTSGMLGTIASMAAKEGVKSFYQGFLPNYLRVGSFNIVLWNTVETLKLWMPGS